MPKAWNIEGTQTPKFDTQKDVFYSVIGLLDEALDGIDESNSKRIDKYDIYYTGDMANGAGWQLAQLKFYMYLANKEDVGDEIKAIIDGGELMNSSADDFVFPFYTTPGNQNPNYQLTVQYPDYYEYCFFANPTVLDPMKAPRRPAHPDLLPAPPTPTASTSRWKRRRRVRSSPTRRSARNRRCVRRRSSRRITCCAPTTLT